MEFPNCLREASGGHARAGAHAHLSRVVDASARDDLPGVTPPTAGGVEFLMSYYPILDRVATGRGESDGFQLWISRHDEYERMQPLHRS